MRYLTTAALFTGLASAAPADVSDVYEYIVIGSGPGGGPLAANLAQAGHSVLLLEAGGDHGQSPPQSIPLWGPIAAEHEAMSWQFFVHHYQNDTQARRDPKYTYRTNNGSLYIGLDPPESSEPLGIFYPRGSTLGGSGQVNAMNLALPPDNDWEYIASITGDDSWSPENIRSVYSRLERNTYLPEGTPGYGFDGWLASTHNEFDGVTSQSYYVDLLTEGARMLEGVELDGIEEVHEYLERDINRPDEDRFEIPGMYSMPLHVNEHRRRAGARDPILEALNTTSKLTLSTHSLATKVLLKKCGKGEGAKPKAYGVEYLKGEGLYAADRRYDPEVSGELRKAFATREVIVSGGAFNTPQILKLSGIGPREELEELDIPVVVDLPAVGKYVQDNYESGVITNATVPYSSSLASCLLDPSNIEADPCYQQWLEGEGPYASGGASLNLLFRSSVSNNEEADIHFFGSAATLFQGFYPGYTTDRGGGPSYFSWSMVKMQTGNAAGTITLRSNDPRDTPIINFNYFEQQADQDLQALEEGFEFAMDLFGAIEEEHGPFDVIEPSASTSVRQSIMDHAFGHHVSSSCRMGPKDDPEYCVDSKFKVNGVDGLRVVDASIFPRTPGAFIVGPTFIASQKAFEAIQEELDA